MRITNGMMASQFLSNANNSLNRVSKTYGQVTTGKQISSISEDPLATIATLKARTRKSTMELYESNISAATGNLKEIESTASSLNDVVQSAYESMVSANSGTKTQDELDAIAEEIANLRDEVLSIGNTSISGTFLFGGYSTADEPFSTSQSGELLYNGVNLTDLGAYEDYTDNMTKMSELATTISGLYTELQSSSCSDYTAQNKFCSELYSALKDFTDCGETVLTAAVNFMDGADTSTGYQNLKSLVDSASSMMAEFYTEYNQELQPDKCCVISSAYCRTTDDGFGNQVIDTQYYIDNGATLINSADAATYEAQGYTVVGADEYENYFHKSSINDLLGGSFTVGAYTGSFGTDLGTVLGSLQTDIETENAGAFTAITESQTALAADEQNQVLLQIGSAQTVGITYSGTSLLGSGNENLYYVLDQCVQALQNGDTEKFSGLIGNLQDRQSDVLTFETNVGATLNRLDALTDRYDTSILNYEEMRSDAEDADEAEAITSWKTAQTVYDAALAAGSDIIQTSLIDFLN